tara:strand:- start:735 stop:1727 length:993 start_codon:yes stop_codon:yes gene_type:complete
MSRVRANNITDKAGTGAPTFPNGLVATSATFTGVVSYEDVTNIDSVGVITARSDIDLTGGNINLLDNVVNTTKVTKEFVPAHNTTNRGATVRLGLEDGSFGGVEVENVVGSDGTRNSQTVHIINHNGGVQGDIKSLTARFDGNIGIGSTNPFYALDVIGDIRASGSFILPNNYALVAYAQGHSHTNRGTTSTSYIDDADNATCRASFANYQRGDIIIFGCNIDMGVALTTNGSNYAGHKARLRATNGSATIDSEETLFWYRNDGTPTKEVASSQGVNMVIAANNTTFNNGDTVYAYIRHKANPGNGVSTSGLSKWGGLRQVWGWHYRKVA